MLFLATSPITESRPHTISFRDVESPNNPTAPSCKIRQRLRNRRRRLALNDAEIHPLVILKPRRRLIARISRNVAVRQLRDPGFPVRDGPTVGGAGFADAEVLAVLLGEAVVEGAVSAGESGAGVGVDVHADDVDVVGTGPPAVEVGDRVFVWGPEHEDFGVAGDGGADSLPGCDEFRLRCRAG